MEIRADDLKLTFPIAWDAEGKPSAFAYHDPISVPVFEANYRIIAATKSMIFSKGLNHAYETGPKIAQLTLMDAARMDVITWDPDAETKAKAFLSELSRRTTVVAPAATGGLEMLPAEQAVKTGGTIDARDWSEALSGIVFFTCFYSMARRPAAMRTAESAAYTLGGSIVSLSLMDYLASLRTSTTAEASAESAGSSVPS